MALMELLSPGVQEMAESHATEIMIVSQMLAGVASKEFASYDAISRFVENANTMVSKIVVNLEALQHLGVANDRSAGTVPIGESVTQA